MLTAEATEIWTPHSGRSFLPCCTAALGFPKKERDYLGGWSPQGGDTYARTARLRISPMQRAVPNVIAQGPEGDRLGEHESMIQLEEHLKEKGHDTHMVAKITKKISGWSVRGTAGENAVLAQGNLEEKTEENPGLRSLRDLTGEENRGLFPSVRASRARSVRACGCRYPGTPRQTEEGRKDQEARWHRRNNDESRSEQRYSQVTMSASLAKLACVSCTSSVLAGWSLEWTTSRLYITAPSNLLPRHIPRYASGAPQKRSQRNQMSRTLRRPPS